jgi:hypothetical protein
LNNLIENVCHFQFSAVRMKVPATALAQGMILGRLFLGTVLPFLKLEEALSQAGLFGYSGDC